MPASVPSNRLRKLVWLKLLTSFLEKLHDMSQNQDKLTKVGDHGNRQRENYLRRQQAESMSWQTPNKKRRHSKKSLNQVPIQKPIEPKNEKGKKGNHQSRRVSTPKLQGHSSLDKTTKGMKYF
jgi:hypothetical protein